MRFLKIYLPIIITLLFMPAPASSEEDAEYLIKVSFSKIKLFLFDKDGNELASLSVALPRVSPKLPVEGEVKAVQTNPFWYPTEPTRKYYLKKYKKDLPQVVGPGDPRNAMGAVKIIIFFETPGINQTIRLHGTNDESSIGKRVSRGCIRMSDQDGLYLASVITGRPTKVLFVE